jgi:hypothetical protein
MKKSKIKIIISSIIIGITVSSSYADSIVTKHPIISSIGVGTILYMGSVTHKARHLSFNLPEVQSFFEKNPSQFNPIAEYVLKTLANPASKVDYDRYRKLAEVMELDKIPPYIPPKVNNPDLLINPEQGKIGSNQLINPIQQSPFSNIIYTPQGKKLDTSTEFPNQIINSWEEYVYAKSQADILAEAMRIAGAGKRPAGYAAHHIVPWDDNRYPVCQDLRDLLSNNHIDINSAENGVYLPTRKVTKNTNEAYHPEIHTNEYYENVYQKLRPHNNDPQSMKDELKDIGQKLKNNKFKY